MTSTKTKNGGLAVVDGGAGDGVPVVLLHSLGGATWHFEALSARLRPTRRVIAIDLPGHGASPPLCEVSIEAMAREVAGAIETLGLARLALVGHSMGGAVAAACAALVPERVAGLVLLDPSSDGRDVPPEAAEAMHAALLGDGYRAALEPFWAPMLAASSDAVRSAVMDGLWRTPREVVIECLGALLRFDPTSPFARYHGPALSVVTAWNDVPGAVHRLVPRVRTHRVEGTGHWLHLDAPEEVSALVEDELARIDRDRE